MCACVVSTSVCACVCVRVCVCVCVCELHLILSCTDSEVCFFCVYVCVWRVYRISDFLDRVACVSRFKGRSHLFVSYITDLPFRTTFYHSCIIDTS